MKAIMKIVKALLAIVVVLLVVVAFFLGPLARPIITSQGSKALKATLTIGTLGINLPAARIDIHKIAIADPAFPEKPVVSVGEIFVDADVAPFFKQNTVVQKVAVTDASIVIRRNVAGKFYVVPIQPKPVVPGAPEPAVKKENPFDNLNVLKWIQKIEDVMQGKQQPAPGVPAEPAKAARLVFLRQVVAQNVTLDLRDEQQRFFPIRIAPLVVTAEYISTVAQTSPEPLAFEVFGTFFGNPQSVLHIAGSMDKRAGADIVNLHLDLRKIDFALMAKLAGDIAVLRPFQYISGIGSLSGDIMLNNKHFGTSKLRLTLHTVGASAANEAVYNQKVNAAGAGTTMEIPVDDNPPYFHVEQALGQAGIQAASDVMNNAMGQGSKEMGDAEKAAEQGGKQLLEGVKGLFK